MAIKNSKYKIKGDTGFDIFHFETNQKSVKILNDSKQEIGNLGELLFTGKTVSGGNIKDIKVSGTYKLNNVSGLPESINKESALLNVQTIGPLGNPDMIVYTVVDGNGKKQEMVVKNGLPGSWKIGGAEVQSTLEDLAKKLGSTEGLKTVNKDSLVGAINETNELIAKLQDGSKSLNQTFGNHNHDDRYVRKDGESILNGNIGLTSGSKIFSSGANGLKRDIIKSLNGGDTIVLGSPESKVEIQGTGNLTYNGKRVLVADGNGEGINANKLGGFDALKFARVDANNVFTAENLFNGGIKVNTIKPSGTQIDIQTSGLTTTFSNLGLETRRFRAKATQDQNGAFSFISKEGDEISLSTSSTAGGLTLTNHKAGGKVFEVQKTDNIMRFSREIMIDGKKLYIQSSQPTGTDHPVGSIWIGG